MSRVIVIANGKGGVGKTSLSANLLGLFAAAGYRCLGIDLDPQGNLGIDLGYLSAGQSDLGQGLAAAALTGLAPKPIAEVRPGLDVVAGGEHLHDLAAMLQSRSNRGQGAWDTLTQSISQIAGDYDLVIIDCPPGSDVLQAGALAAGQWLLVPTRTDDASRAGLREVARRFGQARATNPELQLLGVVIFGTTTGARRILRQAREALITDLGGDAQMLSATIRYAEAAAWDARSRGQLFHELEAAIGEAPPWWERRRNPQADSAPVVAASATSVAEDYQRLAEQVLERLVAAESTPS